MILKVKVAEVLAAKGLTQGWLSRETGIRPGTISGLCRGTKSVINKDHLAVVAEALGVTDIGELLSLEEGLSQKDKYGKMIYEDTGYVNDIELDEERMRQDGKDPEEIYSFITEWLGNTKDVKVLSKKKFVAATPTADTIVIHVLKEAPGFMTYAKKWDAWNVKDNVLYEEDMIEVCRRNEAKRQAYWKKHKHDA